MAAYRKWRHLPLCVAMRADNCRAVFEPGNIYAGSFVVHDNAGYSLLNGNSIPVSPQSIEKNPTLVIATWSDTHCRGFCFYACFAGISKRLVFHLEDPELQRAGPWLDHYSDLSSMIRDAPAPK